jgi:hypothetical protein
LREQGAQLLAALGERQAVDRDDGGIGHCINNASTYLDILICQAEKEQSL